MRISDWLNVLAIVLSPLIALEISRRLDRRRAVEARRLELFRSLMATRASGLAPEHVRALNMIDVEFTGRDNKSRDVLRAWKAYVDHLNTPAGSEVWGARREDMLVELLYNMAVALGYDFDKTHIRRTSYFPKGYGDLEWDQLQMRKSLLSVLQGKASLPIWLTNGADNRSAASEGIGESPEPPQLPQR